MIKGMTIHATNRRVKRSFTLTPDVAAFVSETRQKQRARSDSEALDLLLRESMLEAKRRQLVHARADGRITAPVGATVLGTADQGVRIRDDTTVRA